jgi:glutamate-1-semialdehyde 2,1-aminomutase
MSTHCLCIIQARMGSTRLPGKVLKIIQGKTVISHLLSRLENCKGITQIVVATSLQLENIPLVHEVSALGYQVFCGDENDVLNRYYQAASLIQPQHVVRITGDCPLIDPSIVDRVIAEHIASKNDYTSNVFPPTFPDGCDVEVFTFEALQKAWTEAVEPTDREHVTLYLRKNQTHLRIGNVLNEQDDSHERWTLDHAEDFLFINTVYSHLYLQNNNFSYSDIKKLLQKNPDWQTLNNNIQRNESLVPKEDRTQRISKGQELYKRAKKIIPGGTQLLSKRPEMFLPNQWPPYYSSAKGCHITDIDGRTFVDVSLNGIGSCLLGFADPHVNNAVIDVVRRGSMSTLNSPEDVELAELLCQLHPWAKMVRFARTGGEAVTIATRLARAKSQKDVILFCGYHGWHDWYLSANLGNEKSLDGHLLPGLYPKGVPRKLSGTTYPFAYNDPEGLLRLCELHHHEAGTIVMEAIRNDVPTPAFLEAIRRAQLEFGMILIVDEITSGFRLNFGGAHLQLGLLPDLAVFAKGMSNGFPMAAIIGKSSIMEIAQETFVSSTYWTEKIGPTAALATIQKLIRDDVPQKLIATGQRVKSIWHKHQVAFGLPIKISGIDPLAHFDFTEQALALKSLFTQQMLDKGYLAGLSLYATFAHDAQVLDDYDVAIENVFRECSEALKKDNVLARLKGEICQTGFKRLT